MSLTDAQIAERYSGIGGSDAPAALGLSPFKSSLELFLDKRERRPPSPTMQAYFHWGALLEPVIRQEYAQRTGRVVRVPADTLRHPKHNFMLAHVDGVTDDKRLFEAKTARTSEGWGESGSDEVPHGYLIQVQHYLSIVGYEVADVCVLIGGSDFRMYEIPAEFELQEMIIDGEMEFWDRVRSGTPPEPDYDRTDTIKILRRLYPGTDGTQRTATEEDTNYMRVYHSAAEAARMYQKTADGAKAHLLASMREASRLIFPADGLQLQRKKSDRKGYIVEASSHIDSRFSKLKEIA